MVNTGKSLQCPACKSHNQHVSGGFMKKITIVGTLLSAFFLGLYVGEIADLWNLLKLHNFELSVIWDSYPWWWRLCMSAGTLCGTLAPTLYFFRNKHCVDCAYSACVCQTILLVCTIVTQFRVHSWMSHQWIFDVVVVLVTLVYAGYLHSQKENGITFHWKFLGSR